MLEASRVILTASTKQMLANPGLDSSKRRHLKRKRVVEYIEEHPDSELKMMDLIAVAGYNTQSKKSRLAGNAFIKQMRKAGIVDYPLDSKHTKKFVITNASYGSVTRILPATTVTQPEPKAPEPPEFYEQVRQKAMEFIWIKEAGDLREFVEWLKEQ